MLGKTGSAAKCYTDKNDAWASTCGDKVRVAASRQQRKPVVYSMERSLRNEIA